jgi:hypothetical protein
MEAKKLHTGQRVLVRRNGRKYTELATVFSINVRKQRVYVMLQDMKMINVACEQISEFREK